MDEESLTAAITEYKEQFLQVQNVLQAAGEENQEDLVKIRDDLVELIQLSEERLLTLKKNRLLEALEEQVARGSSTLTFDYDIEDKNVDSKSPKNDLVEEEDIIGTKCRVAYTQEWGVQEHHNAMVFSVEISGDNESLDNAKVRVLFLNPTHNSMVPCPYFLDGKCRFSEEDCRYSHGFLVSIDDLKPFKEPNFSDIEKGQQCLARYSDGIWYKSTIKSVDEDHQEFIVHYDTYNVDATLALDSVIPLYEEESPDLSDDDLSSLSSDDEETRLTNENQDDGDQAVHEWKPTGMNLGEWEQHTRGIGSKLMARMGYIFGKGLGKDGSGRVDPIEVFLLPQGKSLDVCAELREKKKLKEPFKKKRKKKLSTKILNIPKQGTVNDVFLFLNHKFGGKRGNIQDIRHTASSSSGTEQFDIKDRKRRKGIEDDGNVNWNIKLFKIHEEINAVEKQLGKQRQAHGRNTTDANTSSFFKNKVEGLEYHLTQLKAEEKVIKQKMHHKDQHKKLTVF